MKPGLDILNTGHGHVEIVFGIDQPMEVERAKCLIEQMLKGGYVLFIQSEKGELHRVEQFNPKTGVYYVSDAPAMPPEIVEEVPMLSPPSGGGQTQPQVAKRGRGRPKKAVPMDTVRATAIGRSSGG
jgi:hypothetical protein